MACWIDFHCWTGSSRQRGYSLEIVEIAAHAGISVLEVARVLLDLPFELVRLDSEGLDLLLVGTVHLSLNGCVEFKVSNDGLLLLHVDLSVIHGLLSLVGLALQRLSLRDGHTELGKLEVDLEVREEVNHVLGGAWVAHLLQKGTLLVLGVLVDAASDTLKPGAIHIGGHALLDSLGETLRSGEDQPSSGSVSSVSVLLDELADAVEDLATSSASLAGASGEDLLDLPEGVLVATLEVLGLGLGHALDELLDIAELLASSPVGFLLGLVSGIQGLERSVRLIELSLDLLKEQQ